MGKVLQTIKKALIDGRLLAITIPNLNKDIAQGTRRLTEPERAANEINIDGGLLKQQGNTINTVGYCSHDKAGLAAFVLSLDNKLYLFNHFNKTDKIAHSSYAGKFAQGAGEIQVREGKIHLIHAHSGHFKPNILNMFHVVQYFSSKGVMHDDAKVGFISNPISHSGGSIPSKSLKLSGTLEKCASPITIKCILDHEERATLAHLDNQISKAQNNLDSMRQQMASVNKDTHSIKLKELHEQLKSQIEKLQAEPNFPADCWYMLTDPIEKQIREAEKGGTALLKQGIEELKKDIDNYIADRQQLANKADAEIHYAYTADSLINFVNLNRETLIENSIPAVFKER